MVSIESNKTRTFEVMSVDGECSITGGPAHKVVTGVSDDETDVVVASEIDTSLDVLSLGGHDHIFGGKSLSTR